MKELSIEGNAYDGNYKAYTELINRLEDVKGAIKNQNYGIAMDILYKPYPEYQITTSTELKESEDIRKRIIDALHGDVLEIGEIKEAIDWLKNQGKHSNFLSKIQIGDKVTRNEDGVLVNLSQLKRVAKPAEEYNITGIGSKHATGKLAEKIKELKPLNEILEKQGEQEPKFGVGDTIKCKHDDRRFTIKSVDLDKGIYTYTQEGCGNDIDYADEEFELVEQKTAWSEEDDKMFNSALWHVKNSCGNGGKNSGEFEVYYWLKSLKDRVQPKQEWSEEDESRLDIIFERIERGLIVDKDDIDRLKSLKDRYTWKPSEEQMLSINTAISVLGKGTVNGKYLIELQEQLKKLKS